MFLAHQPANVSEEEASVYVMRVRVCFRVFMVDAMITSPFVEVILKFREAKRSELSRSSSRLNYVA